MKHTLVGNVNTWQLFGNSRRFATVVVPFELAADMFKSVPYNGKTGKGEQREIHEPHSRKLEREIRSGTYTPTPVSVGLSKHHADESRIVDGVFTLDVDSTNPLPLTDGSHRFDAIGNILKSLMQRLKASKDEAEKKVLEKQVEEIYKLPISTTVYLDGDPQSDFVNLQLGRNVDTSHLLTMRIRRSMGSTPELAMALEIAKAIASAETGPYVGQIRFDSRGKMPLPLSTLCTRGSSDLSTSLVGLAKVAGKMKPNEIATIIGDLYSHLKATCPEVLEYGKVLTPIGDGGTKGSSTILIGVAICLIHDATVESGKPRIEDAATSIQSTLNRHVNGSFTTADKRMLMGGFAKEFFATSKGEKHSEVPLSLLNLLSVTAYSCVPFPKAGQTTEVTVSTPVTEPVAEATSVVVANPPIKAKSAKPKSKAAKAKLKATAKAKSTAKSTTKVTTPEPVIPVKNAYAEVAPWDVQMV